MASTEEEVRTQKKKRYKEAKWEAKKAMAEAKSRAYKEIYQKLDTKEGRSIFSRWSKPDLGRGKS